MIDVRSCIINWKISKKRLYQCSIVYFQFIVIKGGVLKTSRRSSFFKNSSADFFASPGSANSRWWNNTFPCSCPWEWFTFSFSIRCIQLFAFSVFRAAIYTFAPLWYKTRAVSNPIPELGMKIEIWVEELMSYLFFIIWKWKWIVE